jgi:hypothetical protein
MLLVTAASVSLAAQDAIKEYSESYDIKQGVTLVMDTRYSEVEILKWDNNVADIHVVTQVSGTSKSRAEEILEGAKVEIGRSGNTITVNTDWGNGSSNKGIEKKIHVTVKAPSYLNVDVDNSYGDLFIQEIGGLVLLDLKYTNLKAGKLSRGDEKPYNQMEIAYGNATIDEAGYVELEIAYSDMEINNSDMLFVESKYSKMNGAKAGGIVTEGSYDKYQFDEIKSFVAELKYSGLKFGNLQKNLELKSNYTNVKITQLSRDFEKVDASLAYGNFSMGVENGTAFRIEGESRYGKINVSREGNLNRMKEGATEKVSGTVGSNPRATVSVVAKYGNIDID